MTVLQLTLWCGAHAGQKSKVPLGDTRYIGLKFTLEVLEMFKGLEGHATLPLVLVRVVL